MTDAEIVARALFLADCEDGPPVKPWEQSSAAWQSEYLRIAVAVVAALTEAGRLRGVDRTVRDAIEHLLLFVEQGEHGWTIQGKAATVRAWLDAEPTP